MCSATAHDAGHGVAQHDVVGGGADAEPEPRREHRAGPEQRAHVEQATDQHPRSRIRRVGLGEAQDRIAIDAGDRAVASRGRRFPLHAL
jgi:hypothetical protein